VTEQMLRTERIFTAIGGLLIAVAFAALLISQTTKTAPTTSPTTPPATSTP
jgi:hypothetical protein